MCIERKSFTVDVAYCYEDASVLEYPVVVFASSIESALNVVDSDRFYVHHHELAETLKNIPVDEVIIGELKEV